jgi:hypothetical protein
MTDQQQQARLFAAERDLALAKSELSTERRATAFLAFMMVISASLIGTGLFLAVTLDGMWAWLIAIGLIAFVVSALCTYMSWDVELGKAKKDLIQAEHKYTAAVTGVPLGEREMTVALPIKCPNCQWEMK